LLEGTLQTEQQTEPARVFYAALAFLLTCLFFVAPLQLSARTNQTLPRQIEEETHREENHESSVKAPKQVASWREAPRRSRLARAHAASRASFSDFDEYGPDLPECWDAHSHRRRGPPSARLS